MGCEPSVKDKDSIDETPTCSENQTLVDNVCVDNEIVVPTCNAYQTLVDNVCVDDEPIVDDALLGTRIAIHNETLYEAGSFTISYDTYFDSGNSIVEDKYLFTYDTENNVLVSTKEDAIYYYGLTYLGEDGLWYDIQTYQDENIRLFSNYTNEQFSDIMFIDFILSEYTDSVLIENEDGYYVVNISYSDISEYYNSFQQDISFMENTFFNIYNPLETAQVEVELSYNEIDRVFDIILLTFIDEEDDPINFVTNWTMEIELSRIGFEVSEDLSYSYTDDYAAYMDRSRLSEYIVNDLFEGVLSHSYDIDMVRFTIDSTGTYTITSISYIDANVSLRIFDMEGNNLIERHVRNSVDTFTFDFDEGEYFMYIFLVEQLAVINTYDSFTVSVED